MHRTDLTADLDDTYLFASNKTLNRMMDQTITLDALIVGAPEIMIHAGLVYLADLAQDDNQVKREQTLFENSASDFQMALSIATVTAPAMITGT